MERSGDVSYNSKVFTYYQKYNKGLSLTGFPTRGVDSVASLLLLGLLSNPFVDIILNYNIHSCHIQECMELADTGQ